MKEDSMWPRRAGPLFLTMCVGEGYGEGDMQMSDPHTWPFHSPTQGRVTFKKLVDDVRREASKDAAQPLRICVGSDSEEVPSGVKFVAVVLLWRVGRGARAYYYTYIDEKMDLTERTGTARFRERIWQEIMLTATLAAELRTNLFDQFKGEIPTDVEVHADVGERGGTSVMLREVIGLLQGYGFAEDEIFIKPDALAAASVADRGV